VEEEKEPQPLAAAVPQSKEEDGEKHVAVPPSPSLKGEGTVCIVAKQRGYFIVKTE